MGTTSGIGLKSLQWFIRGIQFLCAAVVLGIFSYFLAALHNHNLGIGSSIRAVEGISGAAVLYTLMGLMFLCCLAGHTITSFIAILLDICFIGGFIYIATVNRHGAGSCNGIVVTPFGTGEANQQVTGSDGFTVLPSFHTACQLQTACLAVSIIAIFFFLFSAIMELVLARHHRKEKAFGPGPQNNYTSGYGSRGGLFGRFRRNKTTDLADDENRLPQHTQPDQLGGASMRQSYGTEHTAVNQEPLNPNVDYHKQETGYGYAPGTNGTTTQGYQAGYTAPNQGYQSGVTGAPGAYQQPTVMNPPQGGWDTAPEVVPTPPPANYRYGDGVYDRR